LVIEYQAKLWSLFNLLLRHKTTVDLRGDADSASLGEGLGIFVGKK
jgi:hypothetical protein